ncbi:MAG: TolC family protein [Desulfobacteraceae bacterium]|jgi:outer membrane protein|nr:MAG: TolC family protein [Desulfobacteraceae bacterium]
MKRFGALERVLAIFFVLSLFFGSDGSCEEQNSFTLRDSVVLSLTRNWNLKAYKEKISQAEFVRRQAGAGFLPKLSMSYGYTRFGDPMTQRIQTGGLLGNGTMEFQVSNQDNYQWKGRVSQPIFTGFAILSSYELARLGINQADLEFELAKLDLVLSVKEAYFGILQADKGLDVAEKAVDSLEAHVKTAENFYRVGMIPVNDLLKAEVELGNANHDLVKARNAATLSRSVFNTLLARAVDAPVEVADVLDYRPEKADFQSFLKEAIERRPEIALMGVNMKQADQRVRLARSKIFPEVAISWEYIKEGDAPDVDGSLYHEANRWEVMLGATWTFWEWGKTHYEVKENESIKSQIQETLKAMKDQIGLQVRQSLLELDEAEKNIPISRKAVEQAEENLRVSQERYKAKVATTTEVLDAQTLLTQARTNYYGALYEHNLARARLERAMGRSE